jgi:hypothetical protein
MIGKAVGSIQASPGKASAAGPRPCLPGGGVDLCTDVFGLGQIQQVIEPRLGG